MERKFRVIKEIELLLDGSFILDKFVGIAKILNDDEVVFSVGTILTEKQYAHIFYTLINDNGWDIEQVIECFQEISPAEVILKRLLDENIIELKDDVLGSFRTIEYFTYQDILREESVSFTFLMNEEGRKYIKELKEEENGK